MWEPNDEDDTDVDPVETTISSNNASFSSVGVSPCGNTRVVTADLVKVCMEEVGKELALKGFAR